MGLKQGYSAGKVDVNGEGFYGVDAKGLADYIKDIKTNVIKVAKNHLEENEKTLFASLRTGWKGLSEARFEEIFKKLITETQNQLTAAENALEGELYAIANAWVEQDQNMIVGE